MVKKSESINKASKGLIEKFYDTAKSMVDGKGQTFGLMPEFDREKALDAVRKDSTVMAALNTLVDNSVVKGYQLMGEDGKSNLEPAKKVLGKLRFNKLLRQIFYNLYAYNNVFIENVKDGNGKIKELHVLETTFIQPVANAHGEVQGYVQLIPNGKAEDYPSWTPDEVTHISITKLTTNIWGEIDVEAVYTSVLVKQYIYAFLGWLFGTNQFRGFYNIEEANEDQVKEFLSLLKRGQLDIEKPVIARGKINYQLLRNFDDGEKYISLLNKCDTNILNLMQVPQISIGLAGDSNRSNSDAQERSLAIRIKSVQNVVEDECRYDLFPKIGFDKLIIEFDEIEDSKIEKLLEIVERMKNIGFNMKVVEEFLREQGFPIEGKLLDKDLYEVAKKSDDMFPSRKGKLNGEGNDKIGSGEEGTTRKDQLVSKAWNNLDFINNKGCSFDY
jgi:hypothetical protein